MTRLSKLAAVAALSTLALAACSSTTTATTGGSAATSATSAAAALVCPAGQITAEGSSAQSNAIQDVIASYNDACKNKAKIEYNPTGSGAGIKNFNAGLVDFAGSDSALKADEATAAAARCM
jgi:phosphate transport system substrate-binding protein